MFDIEYLRLINGNEFTCLQRCSAEFYPEPPSSDELLDKRPFIGKCEVCWHIFIL
jgi:hypothetical protein